VACCILAVDVHLRIAVISVPRGVTEEDVCAYVAAKGAPYHYVVIPPGGMLLLSADMWFAVRSRATYLMLEGLVRFAFGEKVIPQLLKLEEEISLALREDCLMGNPPSTSLSERRPTTCPWYQPDGITTDNVKLFPRFHLRAFIGDPMPEPSAFAGASPDAEDLLSEAVRTGGSIRVRAREVGDDEGIAVNPLITLPKGYLESDAARQPLAEGEKVSSWHFNVSEKPIFTNIVPSEASNDPARSSARYGSLEGMQAEGLFGPEPLPMTLAEERAAMATKMILFFYMILFFLDTPDKPTLV
jgi:hypothetical protein